MFFLKLPFYASAVVSAWVIVVTLLEEHGRKGWYPIWKKAEEYWDLKELMGDWVFERLPIDEQQRVTKRYYALVDEVGVYADQLGEPAVGDIARKEWALQIRDMCYGGKTGIWEHEVAAYTPLR